MKNAGETQESQDGGSDSYTKRHAVSENLRSWDVQPFV
jgi:hypothetical protein